jgi:hypothetical protein
MAGSLVPKTVTGLRWDDHHFTTVVPFSWLMENIISGLVLEDAVRDMLEGKAVDQRAEQLAPMRDKMQRPFKKVQVEKRSVAGESVEVLTLAPTPKFKNTTGSLRDYLVQQFAVSPEEAFGVLPGFVAVWPELMMEKPLGAEIPGLPAPWSIYDFGDLGRGALADGECRHLSTLLINADNTISAALKDKLFNKVVTVEVFHGITPEQAASMFIDLNYEGTPVDTITKANIDPRNKWVQVTKRIFDDLGMNLATTGRQLTQTHISQGQYLLLTHAEQMVKSIVLGPNRALANSKRDSGEASWEGVNFDKLHKAGVTWFGEIFDRFDPEGPRGAVLADQSRVIRTVAVRVALASLGSFFYKNDFEGMKDARLTLQQVNWVVGERWQGIGGKVTTGKDGTARMSAGSGKEHITRAVSAINPRLGTKRSAAWRAVRGIKDPEGDAQNAQGSEATQAAPSA